MLTEAENVVNMRPLTSLSEDEIGNILRPMDFLRPGAPLTKFELFEDHYEQQDDPEWITKEETKMHSLLQRYYGKNSQSNI